MPGPRSVPPVQIPALAILQMGVPVTAKDSASQSGSVVPFAVARLILAKIYGLESAALHISLRRR